MFRTTMTRDLTVNNYCMADWFAQNAEACIGIDQDEYDELWDRRKKILSQYIVHEPAVGTELCVMEFAINESNYRLLNMKEQNLNRHMSETRKELFRNYKELFRKAETSLYLFVEKDGRAHQPMSLS